MMHEWLKRYRIRSTLMLSISMLMLWRVSEWGMMFAVSSRLPGTETAAILAAVGAPATYLCGYVFKVYQENKLP